MKKNKLFLLPLVACALLVSACSSELEVSNNPNRAGAGEAILSVSLQFPQGEQPAGYADPTDNPVPEGVALDAEKEIRSIAFFAFTQGGNGIYLSTNPTFSEQGFTEPLTPVGGQPAGNYTASFKIKSNDFAGKTTLVAIANFKEYGLTFDPGTLTIATLKSMLTEALKDGESIKYPLLMTVARELTIDEGSTVPVDFVMERIMARVDVVNNAYDQNTPANNFVLTSARLLSASAQGTMIGGQAIDAPTYVDMAEENTVVDKAPADGNAVSESNPATQELAPMYAYENSNVKADGTTLSENATCVEVKGTYKGKAYTKLIPFKTLEKVEGGVKIGGEIVPIARNFRYMVVITSGKEEQLAFDLKVTDWEEGKQVDVKLDFATPKLEGLDGIVPANGATWDAATKTLNITKAAGATDIEFVVRGFQDTDFALNTEYDANVNPLAKTIAVERGLLSGYADGEAPLSRTYKVTIPPYTGECPSKIKLIVYNAAYADAQVEIFNVKYAPVFMGAIKSSQGAAIITPAAMLVDLKNVTNGQTGTISFFASCNSDFTTTVVKKGLTNNFYTLTTTVEETDVEVKRLYGPGKRVTVSYKSLTDSPELAEVNVTEGADASTAKKLFVKCFKKPYFESATFFPNTDNTLVEGNKLYLAVNNGEHGTIDYTVYDDASNTITLTPTASNAGSVTPAWIQGITKSSDELVEAYSDFQIVKRTVKVSLPDVIKDPAQAANFKVGVNTSAAATLTLTPVYLSGAKIATVDKAFCPVLVRTVWWSPISIGQTKISVVNDPSSACGNLFQWGRKQPLTWNSPQVAGPVESAEVAGINFIASSTSPYDWLKVQNDGLWNSGTDGNPIKTDNDPCPVGWRVPSGAEMRNSIVGTQTWAAGGASVSQNGLLTVSGLSGNNLYFPAAGRLGNSGIVNYPGTNGYCWVSSVSGTSGQFLSFSSASVSWSSNGRGIGMPVRCVQD